MRELLLQSTALRELNKRETRQPDQVAGLLRSANTGDAYQITVTLFEQVVVPASHTL